MPDPLSRFLYRSIVFREPDRVVHPPSWLEHIPFAFWVVDVLRPRVFVELGTQSGNSYAAFAQAVQMLGLSGAGYAVDTWQGDSQAGFYDEGVYEEWARYHDRCFSSFSCLIRSTFEEAVTHFADGSIDLLHIDGCHTYEAVSADFGVWHPKLSPRGVVLLHDVNVRERDFGAWRFWEEVQAQYPSFEFLHGHGLGVLGVGPDLPEALRWLFAAGHRAEDSHRVRQFFARLGTSVSTRFALQQLQQKIGAELAQREQVVSGLTSDAGQLRAQLNALSARDAHLREESERRASDLAAARADLAIWRKTAEERTHLASELHRLLARESARLASVERPTPAQPIGGRQTGRAAARLSGLSLLAHPRRARDARIVRSSRLFDPDYYLASYSDVTSSGLGPLRHFVLLGAFEGRSPHPLFDTAYYLRRNPDVVAARVNPLVHYLRRARIERRNPHPLFDVAFYLDTNPDVAAAGVEPLAHFLEVGAAEGRNPNPFFDCSYYVAHHPEVAVSGTNPLLHFVTEGWRTGSRPSEAFDPHYYTAQYTDIRDAGENPLAHFLEYGRPERRAPRGNGAEPDGLSMATLLTTPATRLTVRSLSAPEPHRPTVLCVSPFVPLSNLGGSEYRVHRLLRWLRLQRYRVIPVIAPAEHSHMDENVVTRVAAEFGNAVFCHRDGRLEYVFQEVPDVLSSLAGGFATPASLLLNETHSPAVDVLDSRLDRTICHDALITTMLRLHPVLGRYVLLAESIWMCRMLPLLSGDALKVVDVIHPIEARESPAQATSDLPGTAHEHRVRLRHADLLLAPDDEQRVALERLLPGKAAVRVGLDCDIVTDAHRRGDQRRIVCAVPDTADNRSALSDFLRLVWPRIRRDAPDAELVLPGGVGEGLQDVPGVVRLVSQEDCSALYEQARAAISPSPAGASPRREVLEALAHLRPVVTWPAGRFGVPPPLSALCTVVHDWFQFAVRLSALIHEDSSPSNPPAEIHEIARLTSPDAVYQPLVDAVERLSSTNRLGT